MLKSKICLNAMLVALVMVAFACIIFFSSGLIPNIMGDSASGMAAAGGSATAGSGDASSAASEQASLSLPVLLLLLLIPVTGVVMYYYGFVKSG